MKNLFQIPGGNGRKRSHRSVRNSSCDKEGCRLTALPYGGTTKVRRGYHKGVSTVIR